MITLLLLYICSGYVNADCFRSREYVDYTLGFPTEYDLWDYSNEAQTWWWFGGATDKNGDCIEPLVTKSCNPEDWSTESRNATLFTCSEEDGDTPAKCIDAALACSGESECPNGEDEVRELAEANDYYDAIDHDEMTYNNCEEYVCPYADLGGGKCDHSWANADTKLCYHASWKCDEYEDCIDGEDEADC